MDTLPPLPTTPFTLTPGYISTSPLTLLFKERDTWKWKQNSYTVSRATPDGKHGDPYLQVVGESRKQVSIQTADGKEIMRVAKESSLLRGTTYHGMSAGGEEVWTLRVKSGLLKEKWDLTVHAPDLAGRTVEIAKIETLKAKKGVLVDGHPVVAMRQHEFWSHTHREDVVSVAEGMDLVLAVALNWVKIDQENEAAAAASV